jgi:hypothetical protein
MENIQFDYLKKEGFTDEQIGYLYLRRSRIQWMHGSYHKAPRALWI